MKKYFHKTPFWLKMLYPDLIWDKKRDTLEKSVYLTFDDGPTPELTQWILTTLESFQMKGSFFCVGNNIEKYPDLYNEMVKQGHLVANHTFNHLNGWKTKTSEYLENVLSCEKSLSETSTQIFRPPYGKVTRSQIKLLKKAGYQIVMWDVLSGDFDPGVSAKECLEKTIKHTKHGSIVVFHDNVKSASVLKEVLPQYLNFIRKNNYIARIWS